MADRVVPNSLNYTDIKPESIESEIKLVKFQPTSTITGAKGGDMVKFMLSGNGFLDPYSTYFKFDVKCTDFADGEVRFLDRSAHSFIQRIIIRSQGVELERIENYDVIAAMINDVIYSPEQNQLHSWEGFPSQTMTTQYLANPGVNKETPAGAFDARELPFSQSRQKVSKLLMSGSNPDIKTFVGEFAFREDTAVTNLMDGPGGDANDPLDYPLLNDIILANYVGQPADGYSLFNNTQYCPEFCGHELGGRIAPFEYPAEDADNPELTMPSASVATFIIPIYSGVIGLLMPDKKLLPLNLLPLDIEIVFSPHALYGSATSRAYTIQSFNMYSHMIFFESDIHRSLEAAVAEHGIFIYCNSFHSAPQALISSEVLPSVQYISMNLKSINSVHVIFMYNWFETLPSARKLNFVSHNLTSLQLLNGTQLIPQYAIEGNAGTSYNNGHVPFIVETLKAWNKMHDPKTDGAIQAYNFCGDVSAGQQSAIAIDDVHLNTENAAAKTLCVLLDRQGNVGRCQYGISLEGEELGTDKTMITGRKSQYPFLLQLKSAGKTSTQTSYMLTFLRADFIIYIRPDLQIVTLGK